jgi:hypothetical protein
MKVNEDLKTILNKAFSDAGTFIKPNSMETISKSLSSLSTESKDDEKKGTMKLPIGKIYSLGKTNEDKKQVAMTKKEMLEKWSQKYKDSIDCDNPKGFSQKAHCQGKKKKIESKEATSAGSAGGFLGPVGFDPNSDFVKDSFKETPKKTETKEATGASSAGSYVTTAAWAKSLSPKDWRGKSKTQLPGGSFVQVKKKCKTFPYCNQGDINALNITKPKKKTIKELSERHNLSEDIILKILRTEFGSKK